MYIIYNFQKIVKVRLYVINMVESVRNEFIELMARNFKQNGFDDCTSKIVGTLYIEPKEISLEI